MTKETPKPRRKRGRPRKVKERSATLTDLEQDLGYTEGWWHHNAAHTQVDPKYRDLTANAAMHAPPAKAVAVDNTTTPPGVPRSTAVQNTSSPQKPRTVSVPISAVPAPPIIQQPTTNVSNATSQDPRILHIVNNPMASLDTATAKTNMEIEIDIGQGEEHVEDDTLSTIVSVKQPEDTIGVVNKYEDVSKHFNSQDTEYLDTAMPDLLKTLTRMSTMSTEMVQQKITDEDKQTQIRAPLFIPYTTAEQAATTWYNPTWIVGGRIQLATFMGPGTHLHEKLLDMLSHRPAGVDMDDWIVQCLTKLTIADAASLPHDFRYGNSVAAKTLREMGVWERDADERMYKIIEKAWRDGKENGWNYLLANALRVKNMFSDIGVIPAHLFSHPTAGMWELMVDHYANMVGRLMGYENQLDVPRKDQQSAPYPELLYKPSEATPPTYILHHPLGTAVSVVTGGSAYTTTIGVYRLASFLKTRIGQRVFRNVLQRSREGGFGTRPFLKAALDTTLETLGFPRAAVQGITNVATSEEIASLLPEFGPASNFKIEKIPTPPKTSPKPKKGPKPSGKKKGGYDLRANPTQSAKKGATVVTRLPPSQGLFSPYTVPNRYDLPSPNVRINIAATPGTQVKATPGTQKKRVTYNLNNFQTPARKKQNSRE